ncbi:MAG: flagellar hook-length control protein FliK [Pseudomonadota bacterium]
MELPIFPVRVVDGDSQQAGSGVEDDLRMPADKKDVNSAPSDEKSEESFADHMQKDAEPVAQDRDASPEKRNHEEEHASARNVNDRAGISEIAQADSLDADANALIPIDTGKTARAVSKHLLVSETSPPASLAGIAKTEPAGVAVASAAIAPLQIEPATQVGDRAVVAEHQPKVHSQANAHSANAHKVTLNASAASLVSEVSTKTTTINQAVAAPGAVALQADLTLEAGISTDELIEVEIPDAPVFKTVKTAALAGQPAANAASPILLQGSADAASLKDGELEIKPLLGSQENLTAIKPGPTSPVQITAAAQPATTTASASAAAQLIAAIRTEVKTGNIEVRLDPPEMGRVRINMSIETADAVKAVLTVERPETLDHLRRNMSQFIDDLKMAGFASVDLEFSEQSGSGFKNEPDSFEIDPTPGYVAETAPGNIVYLAMRDDAQLDLLV